MGTRPNGTESLRPNRCIPKRILDVISRFRESSGFGLRNTFSVPFGVCSAASAHSDGK